MDDSCLSEAAIAKGGAKNREEEEEQKKMKIPNKETFGRQTRHFVTQSLITKNTGF